MNQTETGKQADPGTPVGHPLNLYLRHNRMMRFAGFAFSVLALHPAVAAPPPLLPFQGVLTNQTGQPVADGEYLVQFKLFDAPTGGNPEWAGEVQKLSVRKGLVSTMLGTKAPLPIEKFSKQLYLEVTADINANNAIDAGDPAMLPRQVILPAVFSHRATKAEHAQSADLASEALEADEAAALQGRNWSNLLDGGTTDPESPSAKLKPSLLPASASTIRSITLAAGLAENDARGKVVELSTDTYAASLSYDRPGREDSVVRGIYLQNGVMQVEGINRSFDNLVPGSIYYVDSVTTKAGDITRNRPKPAGRTHAAMVGYAVAPDELFVSFGKKLLSTDSIWSTENNLVSGAAAGESRTCTVACSDGAGGIIVVIRVTSLTSPNSGNFHIQRLNAQGEPLWGTNGVPLCVGAGARDGEEIASDGNGGAYIAWSDYRSGAGVIQPEFRDIYAQRINSSGAVYWTGNGVAVCNRAGIQTAPSIASLNSAGVIVAWEDARSGGNGYDLRVQKLNPTTGANEWAGGSVGDGSELAAAAGDERNIACVPAGDGGAVFTWNHYENGHHDIRVTRLNSSGGHALNWGDQYSAFAACSEAGDQVSPSIVMAGSAVIVSWQDKRVGTGNGDPYVQKVSINSPGKQWAAAGVALTSQAASVEDSPILVSDGSNGAIAVWVDRRNGTDDVYTQRVNASGSLGWPVAVAVANGDGSQVASGVSDGTGGAFIAYGDSLTTDRYWKRITSNGSLSEPITLSSAPGPASVPLLVSTGPGQSIAVWNDYRSGTHFDVYASPVPHY